MTVWPFRRRSKPDVVKFYVGDQVIVKDQKEFYRGAPPVGICVHGHVSFFPDAREYQLVQVKFPDGKVVLYAAGKLELWQRA